MCIHSSLALSLLFFIASKAVSYQLVSQGGESVTCQAPRRTGIFEESHKVVLKNGKVNHKKEVSYSIKEANAKLMATVHGS